MEITIHGEGESTQVWIHLEQPPKGHDVTEIGESFIIGIGVTRPMAIMDAIATLEVGIEELRTALREQAKPERSG